MRVKQEDLFSIRQGGVREVDGHMDTGRGNYFFFSHRHLKEKEALAKEGESKANIPHIITFSSFNEIISLYNHN